jgi:hypothetical protein
MLCLDLELRGRKWREVSMAEHMMVTAMKALAKGTLGIGELTGKERFMLYLFGRPDRVPTMLAATNVEPENIDESFNYVMLNKDIQANLDLFEKLCDRVNADQVGSGEWLGFMGMGAAELGTKFNLAERRAPYPVDFPIKERSDLDALELPTEVTGYFKMHADLTLASQKRFEDMMTIFAVNGPWDMAMLLRGDHKLPLDLRLHKDYYETDDPKRREKIKQRGDPDFYPAIMEFCTQLSIRLCELAKGHGVSMMGALLFDQYAVEPVVSRSDFVKYISPYVQRVWISQKRRMQLTYSCSSPQRMIEIIESEPPGVEKLLHWANYIFHTTPEGITLPEYDRPALELAKKYKKSFTYFLHGKFLRDASEQELEDLLKRVLGEAVDIGVPMTLMLSSVPPGTDLEKVNFAFSMTEKYGRYK